MNLYLKKTLIIILIASTQLYSNTISPIGDDITSYGDVNNDSSYRELLDNLYSEEEPDPEIEEDPFIYTYNMINIRIDESKNPNKRTIWIKKHEKVPDNITSYCKITNPEENIYGGKYYEWSATCEADFKGDFCIGVYMENPLRSDEEPWFIETIIIYDVKFVDLLPLDGIDDTYSWGLGSRNTERTPNGYIQAMFDEPTEQVVKYNSGVNVYAIQKEQPIYMNLTLGGTLYEFLDISITIPINLKEGLIESSTYANEEFAVHRYCQCPECTRRLSNMQADSNYNGPIPCVAATCDGKCQQPSGCDDCSSYNNGEYDACCNSIDCPYKSAIEFWYLLYYLYGSLYDEPFPDHTLCNCVYTRCKNHPTAVYCQIHGACPYCSSQTALASLELPWQP